MILFRLEIFPCQHPLLCVPVATNVREILGTGLIYLILPHPRQPRRVPLILKETSPRIIIFHMGPVILQGVDTLISSGSLLSLVIHNVHIFRRLIPRICGIPVRSCHCPGNNPASRRLRATRTRTQYMMPMRSRNSNWSHEHKRLTAHMMC